MDSSDFTTCLRREFAKFWLETNAVAIWRHRFLDACPGICETVCVDSEKFIQDRFAPESGGSGPEYLRRSVELMPYFASTFPRLVNEFTLIRTVTLFEVFLTETLRAILFYKRHLPVEGCKKTEPEAKLKSLKNFKAKLKFFQNQLDIPFVDPEFSVHCLQAVHQVRHVLVHNKGIVDKKFIKEAHNEGYGTDYHEGDYITLSGDYMDKAIHAINMAETYLHQKLSEKYGLK